MTLLHFNLLSVSILLFVVLSSLGNVEGSNSYTSKNQASSSWTHNLKLGLKSEVAVNWKSLDIEGEKWLEMQMFAPTRGYVGLGFSPHGGMDGSDIVIAWVDDNGVPHIKDFHGVGNAAPIEDDKQDYELLASEETALGTTVRFRRKWDTCDDDHDTIITTDTMKLIWAYGRKDPINGVDFAWHGGNHRGAQHVYISDGAVLFPFPDDPVHGDPSVKYWDLQMENNYIDGEETSYFCKIVKFPTLDRKHHMIGFRAILANETKKYAHHMSLFECHVPEEHGTVASIFEPHVSGPTGRCYTPAMPIEWGQYCYTFFAPWTIGSEGDMFPEHIGTPLGGSSSPTYFLLEMHYNNPERQTFTDSSAMRIFYTDKLRKYDSNRILFGQRFSPFQMVPPKQLSFLNYGYCPSECTQEALPPEGIKVVSVILHAHLAAKKLRLRHFRNGDELPLIAEDNYYDFNYQQTRFLKEEVVILPGDEVIMECDYNTLDRTRVTVGGLSSSDEMCLAIVLIYPRAALADCRSQPELNSFFEPLGIDNVLTGQTLQAMHLPYDPTKWDEEKQKLDPLDDAMNLGVGESAAFDSIYFKSSGNKRVSSVTQHFLGLDWTERKYSKDLEQAWKHGKNYAYCTAHGRRRVPIVNFSIQMPAALDNEKPTVKPPSNCKRLTTYTATSSSSSLLFSSLPFSVILILPFIIKN